MCKKVAISFIILFYALAGYSQSYDWITGGGSTEDMNPAQSFTWEKVTNMCTDDNGNLYTTSVVGSSNIVADTFNLLAAHNTAYSQIHVLLSSYRCDGTMRWSKLIESSNDTYIGRTYSGFYNSSMAYVNGSIYLAGAFEGYTKWIGNDTTFSNNLSSFTLRFDTSSQFKWIRFIGPDSASTFTSTGDAGVLAVDGQGFIHNFNAMKGNVHLIPLPFVTDTTSFYYTYDLKYDSSGNLLGANRVYFDSLWFISKVIFDKNDNKYYSTLVPDESFWYTYHSSWNSAISAFTPSGGQIWMDTTGGDGGGGVSSLDYKGNNAIYVSAAGNYPDTFSLGGIAVTDTLYPGYSFATIFKLDTNGVAKWVYNLQSNESIDYLIDISVLSNNKIAAVGQAVGTSKHGTDILITTSGEYSNPLLLIVDNSGNTVKLDQLHGPGNDDAGTCITSDAIGNMYVGGLLDINISATSLPPYLTNGGNTDFFIVKYGYPCSCTAAPEAHFIRTGSPAASFTYTGTTTVIDSVGWNFGDGWRGTGTTATHTYTASGLYYPCVTVYTECGSDTYCDTITVTIPSTKISAASLSGVVVYPNPTNNLLQIENVPTTTSYSLLTIVGASMQQGTLHRGSNTIALGTLPTGMYLLQLIDEQGNRSVSKVMKE
jgi:hypothetical protein